MAASAGRDGDQPVDAGLGRLGRESERRNIMKDETAIALHRLDQIAIEAERGDDQRHLALDDDSKIGIQPRVAAMDHEIDAERRCVTPAVEPPRDLVEPVGEACRGALVERRKAADGAIAAAGNDEIRSRDQEHRRGDDGNAQASGKSGRQRHDPSPMEPARLRAGDRPAKRGLRPRSCLECGDDE